MQFSHVGGSGGIKQPSPAASQDDHQKEVGLDAEESEPETSTPKLGVDIQ